MSSCHRCLRGWWGPAWRGIIRWWQWLQFHLLRPAGLVPIVLVSKHVTYSGEWLEDFAVATSMSNASFGFAVHDDLLVTFPSAPSDLIELLNVSLPALQLDREGRSQVGLACQHEQVGHRVKLSNLSPSVHHDENASRSSTSKSFSAHIRGTCRNDCTRFQAKTSVETTAPDIMVVYLLAKHT